jgi:hypothetical protein
MRGWAFEALRLQPPQGGTAIQPAKVRKDNAGVGCAAGVEGGAFLLLGPNDVYATSCVGNAKAVVRWAFDLARLAVPCMLFFDKINNGMGHGLSAEAQGCQTSIRKNICQGEGDPQTKDGRDLQGGHW